MSELNAFFFNINAWVDYLERSFLVLTIVAGKIYYEAIVSTSFCDCD